MKKSAHELRDEINALFKQDVVGMGSDPKFIVQYIPTGVLPFDVLLGGGLPLGRTIEIYGDFSTLKSYLALKAIAAVQAHGGTAALIDTEHAFDSVWATALGVNVKDLVLMHPATGEEAVGATEVLVRNQVELIVWDSVAATMPAAYAKEKPGEDQQPARLASLMSKAMQRLTAANTKTCMLFINQTRLNVGVRFGSPETAPGGRALPFYASMRIKTSKGGKITTDLKMWDVDKMTATKQIEAFKVKATMEKSKLNRPFREIWFVFDLKSSRIDEVEYLITTGQVEGLITVANARWTIPGIMENTIHGAAKFKDWLAEQEEVREWLSEEILTAAKGKQEDEAPDAPRGPTKRKGPPRKGSVGRKKETS